jgi:uncharacterized protein (TIGR03086 family)
MIDFTPAAREVRRLAAGVTDDQLADPTPCPGRPVAGLLDHLMGLCLAFTWAAHKTSPPAGGPGPGTGAPEKLDPAWRTELPRRLDELVDAWRATSAWEGMAEAGGVTMPAPQIGVVALDELVMHGWDLARATGQPFRCDPASTAAVLAFTQQSAAPDFAANRAGLFGPVIRLGDDATDFERALGFAGRDPAWAPVPA